MNRPCLKSGEWNSRNLDKAKKKPILSRGFPKLKLFDDLSYFWTKFKWNVHSAKFARTVALAVGRGRYICCHCLCVLSMDGYISQGWDTYFWYTLARIKNELFEQETKDKIKHVLSVLNFPYVFWNLQKNSADFACK